MEDLSKIEFIPDPATHESDRQYKKMVSDFDMLYMRNCSDTGRKLSAADNTSFIKSELK